MGIVTYVLILEQEESGVVKGKIGRTCSLTNRLKQLESQNRLKINLKRSVFFHGDIESALLDATSDWCLGSKNSEYRSEQGIQKARTVAASRGYKSYRIDSHLKAERAASEADAMLLYAVRKKESDAEEQWLYQWKLERNQILDAQILGNKHPPRQNRNYWDWIPLGTKKIQMLRAYDATAIAHLEKYRDIACELLKQVTTSDIANYLKPCPVDDSDLGVDYQIVYGWMPFDEGHTWGDLEATKVILEYSNAWKNGRELRNYESSKLSKDFKGLSWAPEDLKKQIFSACNECKRAQEALEMLAESV